ncbi:hypothetical protein G6O67_008161 [Ophiocordyceps sinensis]|uniref:Uncharacterized protein n=1 Tax=Ophiocordyceps sinensis TaxID=72228 RepID=A0A8H4LTS5_9HYPO|nr:hypothetical protein G6O67_008161 [Ophiocordyceps sinensis]
MLEVDEPKGLGRKVVSPGLRDIRPVNSQSTERSNPVTSYILAPCRETPAWHTSLIHQLGLSANTLPDLDVG